MTAPQLWPIFICYRRVDGGTAARRLYEMLDKWQTTGPENQLVQVDAYLDETMPGIADWKAMHRPYLEKARALVVVCTSGAKINDGPEDWVHMEIDWWLAHRGTAPILVDPQMEGLRYVPVAIARRWPDIQRIPLVEAEWSVLSGAALEAKTEAVRRQIIGAILPSGAAIYAQELAIEQQRSRRLKGALLIAGLLLVAVGAAGAYAYNRRGAAQRSERVAGSTCATRTAISSRKISRSQENADWRRVVNDWPYWNFVENSPHATISGRYQALYRRYSSGGSFIAERSSIWVSLWTGNYSWDGVNELVGGKTPLERTAEPLFQSGRYPRVTLINRFNDPLGWYAQPQEGLSLNYSTMIEPCTDLGDSVYNKAAGITHDLRGLSKRAPGKPVVLSLSGASLNFSSSNYPIEYLVSSLADGSDGTWERVDPNVSSYTLPSPLVGHPFYLRTRNPFGTSDVIYHP